MARFTKVTQEVLQTADQMIVELHPGLQDITIGFVFRDEPASNGGQSVYGGVKKIGADLKPHLKLDVLIWICQTAWETYTPNQRFALIDHQLSHIDLTDGALSIRGHDIEEFSSVIERWGLWTNQLYGVGPILKKATQMEFEELVSPRTGSVQAVDPSLLPHEGEA